MFKYQKTKGVIGNRTANKDRKYNGQERQKIQWPRKTENTMAKKDNKGQTMIYKILHRKQQHELH